METNFWIICLACILVAVQARGQYFPPASLDGRGDHFKDRWYTSRLQALKEQPLIPKAGAKTPETYRFLWLRTFNNPVAIRIELQPGGTSLLTLKVASGEAGFSSGGLKESSSRTLTKEQTDSLLRSVNKLNFWKAPNPVRDQGGTDGSQWIIEGVKGDRYHVVDRWSPQKGVARELGILFIQLAEMNLSVREIY